MTKEQDLILTDLLLNLDQKILTAVRDTHALCLAVGIADTDILCAIHASLIGFICFQIAHHSTISTIDFGITMSQTLESARLHQQQQKATQS